MRGTVWTWISQTVRGGSPVPNNTAPKIQRNGYVWLISAQEELSGRSWRTLNKDFTDFIREVNPAGSYWVEPLWVGVSHDRGGRESKALACAQGSHY